MVANPQTIHFWKALFRGNICLGDRCLYLQSLKNYKASMFTMLKNAQNATYMVYGGRPKGTNAPSVTFLESSCRADVKL